MYPKLYLYSTPYYLTEGEIRTALHDCPIVSLSLFRFIYGVVGAIELNSPENRAMALEALSRFTVGDCKLTVVPAESQVGHAIEGIISRLTVAQDHAPRSAA